MLLIYTHFSTSCCTLLYMSTMLWECKDNVSKKKCLCTIFSVPITLYVNSQLNGFHKLMVFTIIVSMNTGKHFQKKTVSKSAP